MTYNRFKETQTIYERLPIFACDDFNSEDLIDIDKYSDLQPLRLGKNELKIFLELIEIREVEGKELLDSCFSKIWNLSEFKFPK